MQVDPDALKQLRRLSRTDRERIWRAIERLPEGDVKRLTGYSDEWRLRVGDWRIRFRRHENRRLIQVVLVAPRGSAYRP